MKRILIVKTTSMGDVIHALPALTDASTHYPDYIFDWVVEERFASIPSWHQKVDTIIPVNIRSWRKHPFQSLVKRELFKFRHALRQHKYDLIIDLQGLIKSALIAINARGKIAGLAKDSAREGRFASRFYHFRYHIPWQQHAITRCRQLMASALNYPLPETAPNYGIDKRFFLQPAEDKYIVFLHGTTWVTKQWPDSYWIELAKIITQHKLKIKLAWGNEQEQALSNQIARLVPNCEVLPFLTISEMAPIIANAAYVVAVDTGFAHMAAAFSTPTVSIYGATNAKLTGTMGDKQIHISSNFACSPCLNKQCSYSQKATVFPACYESISPDIIWEKFLSTTVK